MYSQRLKTLTRAYKNVQKTNEYYSSLESTRNDLMFKIGKVRALGDLCQTLELTITNGEKAWREGILSAIEDEISKWMNVIYPADGYETKLSLRVLRGKLHLNATVRSFNINGGSISIKGSQGRLFQQVVSFAAIVAIMSLQGVKTVYVDEAFSGASKKNIILAGTLIDEVARSGFNLVVIAQDHNIIQTPDCTQYVLSRTVDNKTSIVKV